MLYFRIGFENGDSLETGFNGTLEEAKAYYLGRVFNLGAVDDDMQRCNSVEQLPTLEMGWRRGLRPVAWWLSRTAPFPVKSFPSWWMGWTFAWWWMAGRIPFTCPWWMPTTWRAGRSSIAEAAFISCLMV